MDKRDPDDKKNSKDSGCGMFGYLTCEVFLGIAIFCSDYPQYIKFILFGLLVIVGFIIIAVTGEKLSENNKDH